MELVFERGDYKGLASKFIHVFKRVYMEGLMDREKSLSML
jgi:hypothetical protein